MTLSGGQRQRIGIARAFIRNSSVLILDEPTAALDVEAEGRVMEGLLRLMQGKTVIMIAHRLATLQAADKIVVLKNGVVAEEVGIRVCCPWADSMRVCTCSVQDKTVEAAV